MVLVYVSVTKHDVFIDFGKSTSVLVLVYVNVTKHDVFIDFGK